jgi:sialate O-acetylesterase
VISETLLPSLFGDGMVLQQSENVSIWGSDKPLTNIAITTSWGAHASSQVGHDGKWLARIETPKAGGPYEIEISGSTTVLLSNVLIGEVWFSSGQSNMSMPMRGWPDKAQFIDGSDYDTNNSSNSSIRLYKAKRKASISPLEDSGGEWRIASPEYVTWFSAVAYHFANQLQNKLNVPVGIINASWGASNAEAWMDGESLKPFDKVKLPKKVPDKYPQMKPTLLYNGMLNPFIGFNIKGFIWYQGESNVSRSSSYKKLFPALIKNWRDSWGKGDLPFYFVQIAPHDNSKINTAFLREAQFETQNIVSNTAMAVTLDIGDCAILHPPNKKSVGVRLSNIALGKTYKEKGFIYSSPRYRHRNVKRGEGKINLQFILVGEGLTSFNKHLDGFEVAGSDRRFYPAKAEITDYETVTVSSEIVSNPIAARYAFHSCAEASLFNSGRLPASSFRTDDW